MLSEKSKKKSQSSSSHGAKSSSKSQTFPQGLAVSGIVLLAVGAFWFFAQNSSDQKFQTDSTRSTSLASDDDSVADSGLSSQSENLDSPDFHSVRLYLEQKRLPQVHAELQKISQMKLSPEDSQRAERLKILTNCFESFLKDVEGTLKRMAPPVELCHGEAILVETNNQEIIIRIAGENIRFTLDAPKQKGKDLFDIFYRHRYADSVEKGNLKPAIEYATFLLLTSPGDRAKAEGLLKKALEKGNPKDKKNAEEIMTEFNIAH